MTLVLVNETQKYEKDIYKFIWLPPRWPVVGRMFATSADGHCSISDWVGTVVASLHAWLTFAI